MDNKKIKVAITQGDINGIGYEVILKTFAVPEMLEICTPIIYGSPKMTAYHRKVLNLETNFTTINSPTEAFENKLNVINCNDEEVRVEMGKATPEGGKAALEALEKAMADYKKGLFDVLVTAPINKSTIQCDAFHFSGHTEYLEDRVGNGKESLMILVKDDFRVALVTGHIPVKEISKTITTELIEKKLHLFYESLKRDFNIDAPRIAVLALNPHAGDNGLLGAEEQEVIIPAIKRMSEQGMLCFGPYPADGFMGSSAHKHFDGILAMYHDQGLAPFKALAMDEGVNFTAGLSLVRTSPAHGTAYDLVGKNEASIDSFRQAVYMAIDVYRNRAFYKEAHRNPLQKQFFDRRDDSDKLNLQAED